SSEIEPLVEIGNPKSLRSDGDGIDRFVDDPIDPRGDVPSGDDLVFPGSPDDDINVPVDKHGETVLCRREGSERRHVGGIVAGKQTGQLATQHPALSPLLSATLDGVEYLLEHGTLARLPRRDHRDDAAEAG